ncbi:MAG: TatD family hydrolase [Chloroflexi bacterium]|nr:TatD family hydrolase [Chloroflexota bacterium]
MLLIDPHVVAESLDVMDLEAMAASGIMAVISDAAGGRFIASSSEAVFHYADRTLNGETKRAADYFIDVYVMFGLKMLAIPEDYEKILESLPRYLKRDRVVCVGEIGLEPESVADLGRQEELLKAQIRIAGQYKKPVVLHLPFTERSKWIERYLRIIDDCGFERGKVVIAHADATTAKVITGSGCIAGISVLPSRRLNPEDAASIVADNDINLVLVSSDTRALHRNDPLAVPRTALHMRKLGFNDEDITKVLYDNPRRIFNLP